MKISAETWHSVVEFLGVEAVALDTRDWDRWLALYTPDCTYWLPAWRSEGELVEDPKTELSLIYYNNRVGLEGRVFRLRTGRVSSAQVLPRTLHMINPTAIEQTDRGLNLRTHWTVHSAYETRVATYFGYALYELVQDDSSWLIRSKKTVLLNDRVHEVLDFYNV
ncbi:MAG: aromatic-ring-hydroxylating dioxygenase subunit beta [Panacagrimonas sp.]